MATLTQRASSLCDYCHQKPKHNGHLYCSKTCGSLAKAQTNAHANSVSCNYCHRKPKFNGFDYCGKTCANAAKAPVKPATKQGGNSSKQYQVVSNTTAQAPLNGGQSYSNVKPSGPFIPAVPSHTAASVIQQTHGQGQPQKFLGIFPIGKSATTNGTTGMSSGLRVITNQSLPGGAGQVPCKIKGCREYAYADPSGYQSSEYCSVRHQLEAVDSGLVSPCIMCLTMPQCTEDHFCGMQCRDEALSK